MSSDLPEPIFPQMYDTMDMQEVYKIKCVYIYIRICINYVYFVNLPSEILRQTKTSGHLECRVKFLHPLAEGCPESLRGPWWRSQWNVLKPYGHSGFQWNLSKWISVNYMKSKCIILLSEFIMISWLYPWLWFQNSQSYFQQCRWFHSLTFQGKNYWLLSNAWRKSGSRIKLWSLLDFPTFRFNPPLYKYLL